MADFNQSFVRTMKHERSKRTGYSNHALDRGGETYNGISRVKHPSWNGWQIIDYHKTIHPGDYSDHLDKDATLAVLVSDFYRAKFWDEIAGDHIHQQELADELFDTAVNMGPTRAVEFLQESLNKLNRNQKLYPDLLTDGQLGPKTLGVLNTYANLVLQPGNTRTMALLLKTMNIRQGMHYWNLMDKSPEQEEFAVGWLNRVQAA